MVWLIQGTLKPPPLSMKIMKIPIKLLINSVANFTRPLSRILPITLWPGMETTLPTNIIWIILILWIASASIILIPLFSRFSLVLPTNPELLCAILLSFHQDGWSQKIPLDLPGIIETAWVNTWEISVENMMHKNRDFYPEVEVFIAAWALMDLIQKPLKNGHKKN